LSRVVLIGENDTIGIFEEASHAETLIQRIQNGLWEPPALKFHGPFYTIKNGNTVVVTTLPQNTSSPKKLSLTPKEMNLLCGLATGLTDDQIAATSAIRPRTVRFYITRLKKRLGAITREHLVAKASLFGLFDPTIIGSDN
jgi:DNA-binding CsgD family transcriptional regulator